MSDKKEEAQNFEAEKSSESQVPSADSLEEQADLSPGDVLTEDETPESATPEGVDEALTEDGEVDRLPNEIREPRILLDQEGTFSLSEDPEGTVSFEGSVTTEAWTDDSGDSAPEAAEVAEDAEAPQDSSDADSKDVDSEDDESEGTTEEEEKTPRAVTAKPKLGEIGFWISIVLLVAYGLLIAIGPVFLPAGLDEAGLQPGEGGHLLGTSAQGVDLFYETLKAGRQSLLQAILPALAGLLLIYFVLPGISDPRRKDMGSLRRWLIFARLPVTVIALLLSYGFGLYYPRAWVRAGVLVFLALTLWLPEAVVLGRYLYRYRSYAPLQSLYFLGASERDALRMRYGKPIALAVLASFLRMVRMSFLILSVLPFTMDLVSVPKQADWAMSMLIPMQQGEALFVLDRWPHFIAWCLELLFLSLAIWTAERLADCHPLDNPAQVWTNLDANLADELGLSLADETLVEDPGLNEDVAFRGAGVADDGEEGVTRDGDL